MNAEEPPRPKGIDTDREAPQIDTVDIYDNQVSLSKLLNENNKEQIYEQAQFERFKSSLNKSHLDSQYVYTIQKIMNKIYDKGFVVNKNVIPYYSDGDKYG